MHFSKQTTIAIRLITTIVFTVIFSIAFICNVSLAFMADSLTVKILYIVTVSLQLLFLRVALNEIYFLRQALRRERVFAEFGEPVHADHGETLSSVMCGIMYEPVEYVAFFTAAGKKICESTLNHPSMTALCDGDQDLILQHSDCIVVHNHPGPEPVAFSPEDLIHLTTGICSRAIVVTPFLCFLMEAPTRRQISLRYIHRLGRRFYRGHSNLEASCNFCVAAAKACGWTFCIMPSFIATMRMESQK